ncbi:MAG TPA: hypothetical protein VGQ81_08675 [Acidobacteriota bacterium]|nr:hypothetical protein [Acidobacteriota bacterium]
MATQGWNKKRHWPSVIGHQLSVIGYQSSVIGGESFGYLLT